jgi:AcrR family transcriptional regulator
MSISQETIVMAALDILNREGIDKLTMRTIAASLDTKAASLYRHIKDKSDLYNLIAEKVCSEIRPSCGLSNAKNYLIEAAGLYRQKLLALRDSVEIFIHSPPTTPIRLELIKNIMISLLHIGIKEKNCMIASHIFNNYILSFVADEVIFRNIPSDVPNPFEAILGINFEKPTFDEQFNCGLDVLFAGFKILE